MNDGRMDIGGWLMRLGALFVGATLVIWIAAVITGTSSAVNDTLGYVLGLATTVAMIGGLIYLWGASR